jgi:hypothetical protein
MGEGGYVFAPLREFGMWKLFLASGGLALALACDAPSPCADYVDYMCDCHAEEVDCASLRETYASADPAVQDQCSIDLDEQERADAAEGVCNPDDTGSAADSDSSTDANG